MILHRTMCGLNSSRERKSLGDDLSTLHSICTKFDLRGNFANLQRVQCAGSSLWTTPNGVKQIQEGCDKFDFQQALKIQTDLETKLKSQEQLIKQLRDKIELMAWHEELKLNVPQTDKVLQSENTVTPSPRIAVVADKSPQMNVNEATRSARSSRVATNTVEKNDISELESVTTANSKSTIRDQISVD